MHLDYTKLIIAFAVVWFVQGYLAIVQNRSMTKTLTDMQRKHTSGHLGVGIKKAKWNIGKGFYIILVADEVGVLKDVQLLSGFFVTARFKPYNKLMGLNIQEARAAIKQKNMLAAFDEAVSRINIERKHHNLEPFKI